MSVFDVHINRAPVGGRVSRVVYVPGKFLHADLDKASDDNERQYFVVERPDGVRVGFTPIAGLVARRIVKFAQLGDIVAAGQRMRLIRFGRARIARAHFWTPVTNAHPVYRPLLTK